MVRKFGLALRTAWLIAALPALGSFPRGLAVEFPRANAALEVAQQLWNGRGENTKSIDPATNIVARVFDPAGNQIYLTNRNGKVWQFTFDRANRLTNTVTPMNPQTITV